MKKIISVVLCGIIATLGIMPMTALAFVFDSRAFPYRSGDYIYAENKNGGIVVGGYLGDEQEITLPTEIDGKKVTEYSCSMFLKNRGPSEGNIRYDVSVPKKIIIPEGFDGDIYFDECDFEEIVASSTVKSFELYWCDKVRSVSFPDEMKSLERLSLANCNKLENVDLPSNLKSVDSYAFWGCDLLDMIKIPASVESFGDNAFADNTVIYCDYGTEAMKYAIKNNRLFVLESYVLGDCNLDGRVNMKDLLVMRKAIAGWNIFIYEKAADFDHNGRLNMKDVLAFRKVTTTVEIS